MRPSARATPACSGARRGTRYQKPQPPSARHKMTETRPHGTSGPAHRRLRSSTPALTTALPRIVASHNRAAQWLPVKTAAQPCSLAKVLLGLGARNQLTDIMKCLFFYNWEVGSHVSHLW